MIVVLPVCEKDRHLALLNLRLCKQLDGTCPFDCLISYENGFDATEVIHAARGYFKQVFRTSYPPCPWGKKFPAPQNWAWQQAARAAAGFRHDAWLWWEQDAVPLRAGWVSEIATAYAQGQHPVAGAIVKNGASPRPYLAGVAVYPAMLQPLAPAALTTTSSPFDIVASHTDGVMAKVTDISHIIHHRFDATGGGWRVGDPIPDAALYHRCDTGELQQQLLHSLEAMESSKAAPTLTVVITTHNRQAKLLRALTSCWDAGVKEVVVTATGYPESTRAEIEKAAPAARFIWNKSDESNPAWIAGVQAATTKWVHILHDDDTLLPTFLGILPHLIDSPFAYFPARFHRRKNSPDYLCDGPVTERGTVPTRTLLTELKKPGTLSITPVRGVFQRDDLIEWLTRAGASLGSNCKHRPGFLVGNDLWIWLGAATKYSRFYSHPSPITSLGCDSDSTTVKSVEKAGGKDLQKIYDIARTVFFTTQPSVEVKSTSPLHILTIALDAAPWLMGQLQVFNRLHLDWHWTIVEGVAAPTHCTSWCKGIEVRPNRDATPAILQDLAMHDRITVISKPWWDGKLEMVNAPLANLTEPCLLLQVDADEFWEARQIEEAVKMFDENPTASNAMFWCRYFVGPGVVMEERKCFANNPTLEWRRMWRWAPGQKFLSHEPPVMSGDQSKCLLHGETSRRGLVYDHYSYVLTEQVAFKEEYYGYVGAVSRWKELQAAPALGKLNKYFPWAMAGGTLRRI